MKYQGWTLPAPLGSLGSAWLAVGRKLTSMSRGEKDDAFR